MSNFEFLNEKYPELSKLGEFAEKYIYQDSNTTFIKLGILIFRCDDEVSINKLFYGDE